MDSYIRWCSWCLSVTRRVSRVLQELFASTKHLPSPLVVRGVRVTRSLVFYVMFCRSLFVLFRLAILLSVLFLLAIVLSVLFLLAIVLYVLFVAIVLSVPFRLAIVLSVLFLLTIVLSVLLRVTASDYLFGICKLFLFMTICYYNPATPSTKRALTIRKLGTSWRYIGWVRGAVTNT